MRVDKVALNKCLLLSMLFAANVVYADQPCLPCSEVIINSELPTPSECNRVAPFQNYLATTENCIYRGTWSGFYIATGAGFGNINFDLTIPGVTNAIAGVNLNDINRNYMLEFVSVGYSYQRNAFFLAVELGYYYESTLRPFFYNDPSFTALIADNADVTVTPCTVRLDINTHNHGALDLLPGFIFSNRLAIYGRIGAEYSSYSWQRRLCFPDAAVIAVLGDPIALLVDDDEFGDLETDSAAALRLGAGISFAISPHVAFSLNYVHVSNGKLTFTPNVSNILANVPVEFDFLNNPEATQPININTLAAEQRINPVRNEVFAGITFTF